MALKDMQTDRWSVCEYQNCLLSLSLSPRCLPIGGLLISTGTLSRIIVRRLGAVSNDVDHRTRYDTSSNRHYMANLHVVLENSRRSSDLSVGRGFIRLTACSATKSTYDTETATEPIGGNCREQSGSAILRQSKSGWRNPLPRPRRSRSAGLRSTSVTPMAASFIGGFQNFAMASHKKARLTTRRNGRRFDARSWLRLRYSLRRRFAN